MKFGIDRLLADQSLRKPLAGDGDWLTWKPAGHKVNWLIDTPTVEAPDVPKLRHVRPMAAKAIPTPFVDFNLRDAPHAGALKTQAEPADPREQVEYAKLPHHSPFPYLLYEGRD